ncbi:hypothetical protein LNTAR_23694 [Lentisphaera araneosa HTCC2155]|uniref:Uncharacterized protein n=1 Tax=Lentisphaera araneosa HTCC2155 TaxID=313628 RepID=A6DS66_9BACT|nr:hypothetical protein [Lentisphaera araneosa]EDM25526.1 hypothetical protein LNTAR_23694 [Lentisphaera araneosa HTCC2155]
MNQKLSQFLFQHNRTYNYKIAGALFLINAFAAPFLKDFSSTLSVLLIINGAYLFKTILSEEEQEFILLINKIPLPSIEIYNQVLIYNLKKLAFWLFCGLPFFPVYPQVSLSIFLVLAGFFYMSAFTNMREGALSSFVLVLFLFAAGFAIYGAHNPVGYLFSLLTYTALYITGKKFYQSKFAFTWPRFLIAFLVNFKLPKMISPKMKFWIESTLKSYKGLTLLFSLLAGWIMGSNFFSSNLFWVYIIFMGQASSGNNNYSIIYKIYGRKIDFLHTTACYTLPFLCTFLYFFSQVEPIEFNSNSPRYSNRIFEDAYPLSDIESTLKNVRYDNSTGITTLKTITDLNQIRETLYGEKFIQNLDNYQPSKSLSLKVEDNKILQLSSLCLIIMLIALSNSSRQINNFLNKLKILKLISRAVVVLVIICVAALIFDYKPEFFNSIFIMIIGFFNKNIFSMLILSSILFIFSIYLNYLSWMQNDYCTHRKAEE